VFEGRAPEKGAATEARPERGYACTADSKRGRCIRRARRPERRCFSRLRTAPRSTARSRIFIPRRIRQLI